MNKGTKIRTIAFIISIINLGIEKLGAVDFGNSTANLIYQIITVLFAAVAGGFALYYNNDFTIEACIGTGLTRQLKAEADEEYIGEVFAEEDEAEEDESEEE